MTAAEVKRLAEELGFALCRVAPAEPSEHADHVRRWIAAGRHGTMAYLENNLDLRLDPRKVLPGVRSIICVADDLGPPDKPSKDDREPSGHVARYAQFDDYHRIIKKRLHRLADALSAKLPDEQFRACVDTAPVLEREHAARAGIGWVGKNTMVIHPRRGSHLMLGELLTTLALPPDEPETDHCGSCTRCIDACPTQCISPYEIDASRCISYLTIEHREAIDPALHEPIGDNLFGCDICQDICPYNQPERLDRLEKSGATERADPPETYGSRPARLDILDVLGWDEAARREAFTRSSMKRAKLVQMKRNALIVAGNFLNRQADERLLDRVRRIAADAAEDAMVRETAQRVLAEVDGRPTGADEPASEQR